MKLVKSLLLSSAAGLAAVASAQAADLPFRKAAPVEYVRVCDFTGAGYFYIPGTDTCLKVGGYVRADYAFIQPERSYFPSVTGGGLAGVTSIPGRVRDGSGFRAEGRIDADARTQTAYGTLRTYVRFQADAAGGNFASNPAGAAVSPAGTGFLGSSGNNSAYIDKAFIQWAGISAGRLQSYFDFYADNYNFEGIANSDQSTELFAYTATFGGGFSATISLEDANARRDNVYNGGFLASTNVLGVTTALTPSNTEGYAGQEIPDIVGNVRLDQAWGALQLSGAYHQVRTVSQDGGFYNDKDGFAVQAGVQIKLPMLAAGDDLWLEGAYQNGAYKYIDSSSGMNQGFNSLLLGGFQHRDADAYAYANANGSYSLSLSEGYSVMGAFHHFFTPTFSTVLFGSYESVTYGNRAKSTGWEVGGIGDASEYRIGDQIIWTPVNNLSVGLEVIYAHIDQTIAGSALDRALLPANVVRNPSAFEGRLRMERDF